VSGALILPFDDVEPTVHPDAWLAPTATVIGHATIDSRASVFYGAVVRADMDRVVLGAGSNLQDNVVVHTDYGFPTWIGAGVPDDSPKGPWPYGPPPPMPGPPS